MGLITSPGVNGEFPLGDVCQGQWSMITCDMHESSTLDVLGRGLHLIYRFRVTPGGPLSIPEGTTLAVEFEAYGLTQWPYDGTVALTGGEGPWEVIMSTNENDGRANRSREGEDSREVYYGRNPAPYYQPTQRQLMTLLGGGGVPMHVPAWHSRIGTTNGTLALDLQTGGQLLGVTGSYPIRPGTVVTNNNRDAVQVWTEVML